MQFLDVTRRLAALGWERNGEVCQSPLGDFSFARETLEHDPMLVYAPAARRVHLELARSSMRTELRNLLAVLEGDPTTAALAMHVHLIHATVASWSPLHGAKVSLWEFGYASVRAAARHPEGGGAAIDCLADDPPGVDVLAYHWVDDWTKAIRRGWRVHFRSDTVADRRQTLDKAVRSLLELRDLKAYSTSALSTARFDQSLDEEYWAAFQILR